MGIDVDVGLVQELLEVEESWAFRASSYAFHRNAKECLDCLHQLEHMEPTDLPEFAGNTKRQEEASFEVMRLLSNCVGAAVALKHAVNGVHRRLHRDGSFPEFVEERNEKYDRDPVTQFVIKLRDYLVHVKPLGVVYRFHVPEPTDASTIRMVVGFDLAALSRDAGSWRNSAPVRAARRYLVNLEATERRERPTLFMHVLEFRTRVEDFYRWFAARETELQRERLAHAASQELLA